MLAPNFPEEIAGKCYEGDQEAIEAWLDGGGGVDARDENGGTLLMLVATFGREPIVERLLERKAAVDLQDRGGYTALMEATFGITAATHPTFGGAIVRRLLAAGANIELRTFFHQSTALEIAEENSNS